MAASRAFGQMSSHRSRSPLPQPVSPEDSDGLPEGCPIRRGRTGGDHLDRVPDDIGEDQRDQSLSVEPPGPAASFDPRQVLAHGVDLVDQRACPLEKRGDLALVGQADAGDRSRQQSRSSAGKEAQREIALAEQFQDRLDPRCADDSPARRSIVRLGPGAPEMNCAKLPDGAVRDIDPAVDFLGGEQLCPQDLLDGPAHTRAGLPTPDDGDRPDRLQRDSNLSNPKAIRFQAKGRSHQMVGIGRHDPATPDQPGVGAQTARRVGHPLRSGHGRIEVVVDGAREIGHQRGGGLEDHVRAVPQEKRHRIVPPR